MPLNVDSFRSIANSAIIVSEMNPCRSGIRKLALILDFSKYDGVDLPHVFSVLDSDSKAGKEAIDKAVEFYRKHIDLKDTGVTD